MLAPAPAKTADPTAVSLLGSGHGNDNVSRFWVAYLRVGYSVLLVEGVGVLGYLVSTPHGPHRAALLVMFSLLSTACVPALALAPVVATQDRHERVALISGVLGLVVMTGAAVLDTGIDSPIVYLNLLAIFYTAVGLRPRAVLVVVGTAAAGVLLVALTDPERTTDATGVLSLSMLIVGASVLAVLGSAYRSRLEREERRMLREISWLAATDGLTGCWNSRSFYQRLEDEVDRALRYRQPLSLLVCDVDRLKALNDTHGHLAGDAALAHLGASLLDAARSSDFVARVGGDEFAVIMPGTGAAGAATAARRIVDRLAGEPPPRLTVSIGVAELSSTSATPLQLFRQADTAMYRAKELGQGSVARAGAEHEPGRSRNGREHRQPSGTADHQTLAELARRAHRQQSESAAILAALTEEAPAGFAFVDSDLRLVWANPALVTPEGTRLADRAGWRLPDVWPEGWAYLEDSFRRVLEGSAVRDLEVAAPTGEWLVSLYPVRVDGRVIGIGAVAFDISDRKRHERAQEELTEAVVAALARAEEARDPYTAGHQARVAAIAAAIATELGHGANSVKAVRLAGEIHDIGKLSIPAEILSKPGRLTKPEMDLVRTHPVAGYEILRGIDFPWPVADMVVQHHERLDGSGYPDALRGERICTGARILAVADVLEAMSAHRPYRAAPGIQAALDVLRDGRGTLFDPSVIDACIRLWESGRLPLAGTREAMLVPG